MKELEFSKKTFSRYSSIVRGTLEIRSYSSDLILNLKFESVISKMVSPGADHLSVKHRAINI